MPDVDVYMGSHIYTGKAQKIHFSALVFEIAKHSI